MGNEINIKGRFPRIHAFMACAGYVFAFAAGVPVLAAVGFLWGVLSGTAKVVWLCMWYQFYMVAHMASKTVSFVEMTWNETKVDNGD